MKTTWNRAAAVAGALWLLLHPGFAGAQRTPIAKVHAIPGDLTPRVGLNECGDFSGHFGPLDFRVIDPLDKRNVESNHFEQELATFLAGRLEGKTRAGTGSVMGGFNYTAKAIPNHPAALLVIEQLGRRLKTEYFGEYPLECYYLRAFMIAPDDPAVRALYGIYLGHRGREAEALANLKIADDATHDRPSLQYHIGLAYLDLKRYESAQLNAMRAAKLRFPLDALAKSLKQSGKWNDRLTLPPEPDEGEAAPPASASSPAAEAPAPRRP